MLTEKQKQFCKDILSLLPEEDLFSVANTSTNRLVAVQNAHEAVDAILSFTETPQEFLKRRKITKEILVRYLLKEGLPPMRDDSKEKTSDFIITYWDRKCGRTSEVCASNVVETNSGAVNNVNFYINVNYSNVSNTCSGVDNTDQENAEAFVKWFFSILNSHNPSSSETPKDFGPHHFWENAKLFLSVNSRNNQYNEEVGSGQSVHRKLLALVTVETLLFNPNVCRDGVMIKSSPHGLKLIMVCGTLHKNTECIGTFEQSFGLIEDPRSPNSWKIKVTCLKMDDYSGSSLQISSLPRLQDCSEIGAVERYTLSALDQLS